jgi:hypothetical protein
VLIDACGVCLEPQVGSFTRLDARPSENLGGGALGELLDAAGALTTRGEHQFEVVGR